MDQGSLPRGSKGGAPWSVRDRTLVLVAVATLLLAFVVLPLFSVLGMAGMMGMMGPSGMLGGTWPMLGMGLFGILWWFLVLIGVILLVVWGVRQFSGGGQSGEAETPLATLQRRYARGEVSQEDYERIRSDLLGDQGDR